MPSLKVQPVNIRRKSTAQKPPLTVSRPELLVDGSDWEFRQFVHGMLALTARIEAVRAGFANWIGLTGIQYTILIAIGHLETESVSITMVANHLHLSGAFVTAEVGKLLRLGLVEKRRDLEDRRRVCLSVTRKGCDRLAHLAPIQVQVNDVLFQGLDVTHFRQLKSIVEKLNSSGGQAISLLNYVTHEKIAVGMPAVKRPR